MGLTSFAWIIKRELAGSGRPGLLRDLEEDIESIKQSGIRLVITLTANALTSDLEAAGLDNVHFPIPDMGITTPRQLEPLCVRINVTASAGAPVLVHCRAGLGRTGMVLACCLVHRGVSSKNAIRYLRAINPRYIQTSPQERLVEHYSQFIARSTFEDPTRF